MDVRWDIQMWQFLMWPLSIVDETAFPAHVKFAKVLMFIFPFLLVKVGFFLFNIIKLQYVWHVTDYVSIVSHMINSY